MGNLYYNLTGGVDLHSSKTGMPQSTKKLCWFDSVNVEIYKNSGVKRMQGNTLFRSFENGPEIKGVFEYVKGDKKTLVANTSEGKFYAFDNSVNDFVLKKSGLDTDAKCNYVNYLNGVICSNGVDEPFFYEQGVDEQIKSCNAVRGSHNIRGKAIAVYMGRIFIGESGTLYYSALGKFDDWQSANDAGYISNFHNDSSKIVALKPYKGYLAIYKENQTYLLTGDNPDNFAIVPFADKGSVSPFGVTTAENEQYFFDSGVFTLEQIGELNQIRLSSEVSKAIHSEFEKLDVGRLNEIITLHYAKKMQIWFFLPYSSSDWLNNIWIYDYQNKAWFKRLLPQKTSFACCYEDKILTGTADGKILIEDNGNYFDTEPINFCWSSPFINFGEPNKLKSVDEFYMVVDQLSDNSFVFSTKKNYTTGAVDDTESITVIDAASIIWDSGDWSEGITVGSWAIDDEVAERVTVSGSNKSVMINISGDQAYQNIALLGFEFRDVILDE